MIYLPTLRIRLEMAFGHVGRMIGAVDQYVVPGPILRRSRARHLRVPLLGSLKDRIDIHDDAAVAKTTMTDDLSNEEFRFMIHAAKLISPYRPMIRSTARGLRIAGALLLLTLNSLLHVGPLLLVALVKAVVRLNPVRDSCDRWLMALVANWIDVNSWMMDRLTSIRIHVEGLPEPMPDGHFMILSNHQSWVDIPVLQKVLNHRLPMLRFFLKSQLIWVPILGLAWWALDFPFMKRYSREQVARRPELAGRDIEATRTFCRKFSRIPVAVGNFVEGTRYTEAKHAEQNSPHRHLLKPRAGGTAFVLDAMGKNIDRLVDVTIVYPHGRGELVDLFADRIPEVRMHIRLLSIPERFRGGDYAGDEDYRAEFQQWLNELWRQKDATIDRLLEAKPAAEPTGKDNDNDNQGQAS